jgi:hypothetical protein
MIELNIIERDEIPAVWLQQFKAYASVADDSQDSLLNAILTKAVMTVQQKANKSLIACTIELHEDEVEDNTVRLYQTVSEVVTVTDGTGNAAYWQPSARNLRVYSNEVVVEYKTEPRAGDIDDLLPVVFQYATALYDGEDSRTLANILSQC